MTTIRTTAYALCLCDDGQHEQPDLLIWRTTIERAEAERVYYPAIDCHLRQRVLVESDYTTDAPTDEPDAPVGEVPPAPLYVTCPTCRSHFPGKVPGADGKLKRCPTCYGNTIVLATDVAA